MGDAGDQTAQRRQTLGINQVLLGGVQFEQRALRPLLGSPQLIFGLALGDGVFAEYLDRPRHRADLVSGVRPLHLQLIIARCNGLHGRHDLLQGQPDAQRDHHTGGEDESEQQDRDRQYLAGDGGQREIEGRLRRLLALAHAGRYFVDGADGVGLTGIDAILQQRGSGRELRRQF